MKHFSTPRLLVGILLAPLAFTGCRATVPDADPSAATQPLEGDREREEERDEAHPHAAAVRWAQRLSEDGTMPPNAIYRMKQQRDFMVRNRPEGHGNFLRNWKWLGPGNQGGRVRSVVFHPTTPTTMWCGSVGGGIWKTTNSGASWAPQDDFAPMMSVGCMAIDKTNPNRLYAGTGEGFFNTVAGSGILACSRGAGVFVTTNGGTNWAQLPSTSGPNFYFINRIAISPADSKIVLLATSTGIWRSTNQGTSFTKQSSKFTFDLAFHPSNGNLAVAGTKDGVPMYSTNGGVTWTNATGIATRQRVEISYAPGSPTTVYASVSQNNRITVYRSTNGGRSYSLRTSGSGIGTYSRYNNTLWVDPTNSNHILVGAIRLHKSTNGGTSFVNAYSGSYYDYHTIVSHPNYNGSGNLTVVHGNDGGVYRTTNVKASTIRWSELNNNLGITQFYGAAMAPNGTVIGGTQDLGTLRYTGNKEAWTRPLGGDGCFCAADPTNSNYVYGQIYYIRIYRSTNNGASFRQIANSNNIRDRGANFIPYLTLDPNNANRMYFCAHSLWRTDAVRSGTPVWKEVKPSLGCTDGPPAHFDADPRCNISNVQIAKGNANTVWVGHNHGDIYMTTNALATSATWKKVDVAAMPNRWVGSLAIDPNDSKTVYACFLGYHKNNVWVTRNAGTSWQQITGSGTTALPESPVNWITVNPRVSGCLFVGTDIGLFFSRDDGATWETSNKGSRMSPVAELQWKNDNTMIVTTHGRGIYTVEVGNVAMVKNIGGGCGISSAPVLSASLPKAGSVQTYSITSRAPNKPVLLMFSPTTNSISIGGGCTLHVFGGAYLVTIAGSSTGSQGQWTYRLTLPKTKEMIGMHATVQAAILNNGPALGVADLTNGLELTTGF